jgi:hypothetical protein
MPVAANHGAARIMKMNVIRPSPYLAWNTLQPQYHSRPDLFHASTENASPVAGWAQDRPPSLAPHIRCFAAPPSLQGQKQVAKRNRLAGGWAKLEFTFWR